MSLKASRRATAKLPGPLERSAARSPAMPKVARAAAPASRDIAERCHLRRVAAHDARRLMEQRAGEGEAAGRAVAVDGVERPREACRPDRGDRGLDAGTACSIERTEIDEQRIGTEGKICRFLGAAGHRGVDAHRAQTVGGKFLDHRIGQAVGARRRIENAAEKRGGGFDKGRQRTTTARSDTAGATGISPSSTIMAPKRA